ncbi:actin-like ATPase domain-containing protein [Auriculariales sp. MPI-PUGE-AT-0066]|nr:actin-like ATPase domain-containing protein [Auriculariales sp. MPI-PUGE-AT-0066]
MTTNDTSEAEQKTVIGINFGNTYSSIAVLSNERTAECIANENGERQIASVVSFSGEEIYTGNQALPQLVKNARNTITGFRNLLGKTFAEVDNPNGTGAAAVIKHPESDLPAYAVEIVVPAAVAVAPKKGAALSKAATPAASMHATPMPTPPREPERVTRTLSVPEVTTMFLKSLLQSATDYLGTQIDGAVFAVPAWFSPTARDALKAAAEDAGIPVLQLIEEPGAAAALAATEGAPDRTSLILDAGASQTDLAVLSLRAGLASVIASSSTPNTAGHAIDDRLVAYFAKEFTKKTKEPLAVPAKTEEDARAERKLRLAVDLTKRAVSASTSAAACSVESLKAGLDLSATVNRLRFDLEAGPVYTAIADAVRKLLADSKLEALQIDEVLLVGGTAKLPGLQSKLELVFPESTTFSTLDPTEVLARGCVLLAREVVDAAHSTVETKATSVPLGVFFPGAGQEPSAANWITVVPAHTPLPARRTVSFAVQVPADAETARVGFEAWEATTEIVHPPAPEKSAQEDKPDVDDEEDDFDEEDEPPAPELVTRKTALLGALALPVKGALPEGKKKGARSATVLVEFVVKPDGSATVAAWEQGAEATRQTFTVPTL